MQGVELLQNVQAKIGSEFATLKPNIIESSAESESVNTIPFGHHYYGPKWTGVHTLTFSRSFKMVWFDCTYKSLNEKLSGKNTVEF